MAYNHEPLPAPYGVRRTMASEVDGGRDTLVVQDQEAYQPVLDCNSSIKSALRDTRGKTSAGTRLVGMVPRVLYKQWRDEFVRERKDWYMTWPQFFKLQLGKREYSKLRTVDGSL